MQMQSVGLHNDIILGRLTRFERNFTIYLPPGRQRTLSETGTLSTPLLPGLEISMPELFANADKYSTGLEELDGQL